MKKYIFGIVLSIGILVSPVFAQAAGLTSTQVQAILSLLSSFGADSVTIANVNSALTGIIPITTGGENSFSTATSISGGIYSFCSTSFSNNSSAVKQFQAKYGISQTGNVGPLTRAKLNTLYRCNNGQQSTPVVSTTQSSPATASSITSSNDWVVVFTNRGTEVPQDIRTFICGTALPTAVTWFAREAATYGKTKPFGTAKCIDQQVSLSGSLLSGSGMLVEGSNFNSPINADAVITLLEQDSRIKTAKFVTVIHYMENDLPFANFMQNSKYDFGFIRKGASALYYPDLAADSYSEEFLHEFMHKLGATDKYDGSSAACLTDPKTGSEYSGYDIMCHRIAQQVYQFGTAYQLPPLSQLVVTDPTALEIDWK